MSRPTRSLLVIGASLIFLAPALPAERGNAAWWGPAPPSAPPSQRDRSELDRTNLPDTEEFLREIRKKLEIDERRQLQYTYLETVTERERDGNGRVQRTKVQEYEVSSAQDLGYRRLTRENGRPVPPAVLSREDAKHREKVEAFVRERQRESSETRAKRLAKEARGRVEEQQAIDELFRMLQGELVGRDALDGRATLVLAFHPRPNVKPTSRIGRVFRSVEGRAWFHEIDRELMKVDLQFVDNVSFGLGVLARLRKGATAAFERRLVDGEQWLPARYSFFGSGRVMMFKSLRIDTDVQFSQYRRATVATNEAFSLSQKPD